MWKQRNKSFDIIIPVEDSVKSKNVNIEIGPNKDNLKISIRDEKGKNDITFVDGKTVGSLNPHECLWFLDYDMICKSKCIFVTIGKHTSDGSIWSRLFHSEIEEAFLLNQKIHPL